MTNDARPSFTMPAHLASNCPAVCRAADCPEAVKLNATTGRWFITIGHGAFNSAANNRDGYATEVAARAQVDRRFVRAEG